MRRLILEEPISRAAATGRRVAIFAVAVAACALLVGRLARTDSTGALAAFGAALGLAGVALLLSGAAAVEIWRTGRRGAGQAALAALLAVALAAFPLYLTFRAALLPRINQATTDFKSPPAYMITSRAREARGGWEPPPPGPEVETEQRLAYPEIKPMLVDLEPDQAYRMSLRIAKDLGWRLVDASPPNLSGDAEAHIEATARSLFFGFIDDIAVRIRPQGAKTEIDVRSASRVGRHDFGANAHRIARFIAAVQASTEER